MRYWSLLLAAAFAFTLGVSLYAPFDPDWWLPNYETTNRGAAGRLVESSASIARLAGDETALAEEVARKARAKEDDPEKARAYAKTVADLRGKIERERGILRDLAAVMFVPERTRPAAAHADEAVAALTLAEGSLKALKLADAPGPLETAGRSLNDASAELTAALAGLDVSPSSMGRKIDDLFVVLSIITGVVFVLTQLALVYVMWRFAARPGRRALYSHGSQRLEVIWTLVPAVILVFIAFHQMGAWADIKFRTRLPEGAVLAEVTARQFQWVARYAGEDGKIGTADDLFTTNDFHFVKGERTRIDLKSADVIHSFFIPQLRIKQDALPGPSMAVWFDTDKAGRYELVCAELCGWGHYKMRANVVAHETRADFDEWQKAALREQNRDTPAQGVPVAADEVNRTR